MNTKCISTDVNKSKRVYALPWLIVPLVFAVAMNLNLQNILQYRFGLTSSLGTQIWVLVPCSMMIFYLKDIIANAKKDILSQLILVYTGLLITYGWILALTIDIHTGIFSFLTYGVWVGLYFWLVQVPFRLSKILALAILLCSGIINSGAIIYEYLTQSTVIKITTIGDVTRLYGISTSLSIQGLQLACSILAAVHLMFVTRKKLLKFLSLTFIGFSSFALIISTIRAPLIYMIIAGWVGLWLRFRTMTFVIVLCLCLSVIMFIILFIIMAIDYDLISSYLLFLLKALTLEDESNQLRLRIFAKSWELLFDNLKFLFIGKGPGLLSQIPLSMGKEDFGTESSLLKGVLELGILGMLPVFYFYFEILKKFLSYSYHTILRQNAEFVSIFLLISFQCCTHESFITWIGSLYFFIILGVCTRLIHEIKASFNDPRIESTSNSTSSVKPG